MNAYLYTWKMPSLPSGKVKGWRREKKEALIRGDYAALPSLARRGVHPSRRGPEGRSSG
jgi:hypothetical protein